MPLEYMKYATANKQAVSDADEWCCIYCLEHGIPADIISYCEDTNGLTCICPYCSIDAVIPRNVLPSDDIECENKLREWRQMGFD